MFYSYLRNVHNVYERGLQMRAFFCHESLHMQNSDELKIKGERADIMAH